MGSSINLEDVAFRLPPDDANFHRRSVADILGRPSTNFPGAQPVSFARDHLVTLQKDDYFLCEKTDGIRCLLYLTALSNPPDGRTEAQFLIDRKNDYYYIRRGYLHLPLATGPKSYDVNSYHIGSLLDGELVRQRMNGVDQLTYLIFDCLALQGQSIMNRDYSVRIGKFKDQVYTPWKQFAQEWPKEAEIQPFQLKMKDWQLPYGTDMMFRQIIPNLPHGNDGLIFTNKNTPYVAGTDQHILKWKPPHENTVDFRLQLGAFPTGEDDEGTYEDFEQKPEMELLVYHGGGSDYRKYADLDVTDTEWEAMKRMDKQLDWRIIECFRDAATSKWRPKLEENGAPRFRDDKEHANHITVVKSVIESIEDAVSEQDLIAVAVKVRTAYKEREEAARQRRMREREMAQRQNEAAAADRARRTSQPPMDDGAPRYED